MDKSTSARACIPCSSCGGRTGYFTASRVGKNPPVCQSCRRSTPRMVALKCGTVRGRDAHRRRGEKPCEPCRLAWNEACKGYRAQAKAEGWRRSTVRRNCAYCNAEFETRSDKPAECCTHACAQRFRHGGVAATDCKAVVLWVKPAHPKSVPVHTRGQYVWRNRDCLVCGDNFTSWGNDVTCSDSCSQVRFMERRRALAQRRRARRHGGEYERFLSSEIFERDGFRCHICGRKTMPDGNYLHPRYPTIDHLIPLSKGGPHTRANVACACRLCNSIKSDRLAGDQLALI